MVSGGQVRSDANSLNSIVSSYSSAIDGLNGSWQGSSYDSISSQAQSFISEVTSTISSQMESFATACDLYEEYKNLKNQLEIAQSNYNMAVSGQDTSAASSYSSQIDSYNSQITALKGQIESALSAAKSGRIESTKASANYSGGTVSPSASSNSVVENAIDWAVAVAEDDTHGYSQNTRWGNPNYDCSSLVISAYESAGVPVKDAGASYTGNMKSAFVNSGFEWIPGSPDNSSLKPGDVLLDINHHTELYIGDGKNVGAHSNFDGKDGDSSGKEINVSANSYKGWDGVLRYVGNDSTTGTVDK